VGSAYLFEKYRDKAERGVKGEQWQLRAVANDDNEMPRFSDITDDNAYNSSTCYTDNNCYKLNKS
jgi:hypothetical protein